MPVTRTDSPVQAITDLTSLIERYAGRSEADRRLAPQVQNALADAGLFRMLLPRSLAGLEVTPAEFHHAIETAAAIDGSTAWCLCQGNGCAMVAAYLQPAAAQRIFGSDPRSVLAWGPGRAEARAVDGGYRVTAHIAFASGGRHASWLGCHVPVSGKDGTSEIRTMLFPASEATWFDTWDVLGLCATGSDDFEVHDLFVPEAHTAIRDTGEFRTCGGQLFVMPSMSMYAIGFSATAQGIARSMVEAFKALAQEKTPRLARSKLVDDPVIHHELGVAEARLRAARAYLVSEISDIWAEVRETGTLSVAGRMRLRLSSTHGIHEAKSVAGTIYDLAGASAIRTSGPFERRYRDIRSVTQQLQGRPSHFRTVGSYLMGHEADLGVA